MITELFSKLVDIIDNFTNTLVSIFNSAVGLFYDGESITSVGLLMLLGLGTGLLIWGFKFIRKLIRVRTK